MHIVEIKLQANNALIADHQVNGLRILPGVVLIETAMRLLQQRIDWQTHSMTDIVFYEALILMEGEACKIRITFDELKVKSSIIVEKVSLGDSSAPKLCMSASITKASPLFASTQLSMLINQAKWLRKIDDLYMQARKLSIIHGDFMQAHGDIYEGDSYYLVKLFLSDAAKRLLGKFKIHPVFLDAATLVSALPFMKHIQQVAKPYIPVYIKAVCHQHSVGDSCYIFFEKEKGLHKNEEIKHGPIVIYNQSGQVAITIEGLHTKQIRETQHLHQSNSGVKLKPLLISNKKEIDLDNIILKLREIVSSCSKVAMITNEADFFEMGIDSRDLMQITQQLEIAFGKELYPTLLFEYKNINSLAYYLLDISASGQELPHEDRSDFTTYSEQDIAIIGMSGSFPGGKNINEYWEMLKSGSDCIEPYPRDRLPSTDYQYGGFIEDIDKFDATFFNISPHDAKALDPQERLFLHTAFETFLDAGIAFESPKQPQAIGVFVGAMFSLYQLLGVEEAATNTSAVANSSFASIANHISYYFNLTGPSLTLDSMCSSSLTALYLACDTLKNNSCKMALVGGVNIISHPYKYRELVEKGFISPIGKCQPFNQEADGYVPSEGVGAVLIKKLSEAIRDGDQVYAIIKGIGINHSGKSSGYTVPDPIAQAELIKKTLSESAIDPSTISYFEAHGTGTALGDPIEVLGMTKAFQAYTKQKQFCAIGSVKGNIGHLESAAGIAGLIKIILQLRYQQLVPSINSQPLNRNINFEDSPFYVQTVLAPWQDSLNRPLRAAMNSFGAGGSNACLVLEQSKIHNVSRYLADQATPHNKKSYWINKTNRNETTGNTLNCYQTQWEISTAIKTSSPITGLTVLFMQDQSLATTLAQQIPTEKIIVIPSKGGVLSQISTNLFSIDFQSEEHYSQLLHLIQKRQFSLLRIIYHWRDSSSEITKNKELIQQCIGSLHLLVKAILNQHLKTAIQFFYIYSRSNDCIPLGSIVVGYLKSLILEHAQINFRTIEISTIDDIQAIQQEWTIPFGTGCEVRYHGNIRKIKTIAPVNILANKEIPIVKAGGVYLIAGGSGKLGQIIAGFLTAKERITLILLGRSKPDTKMQQVIQQLQKSHSIVEYYSCDIADEVAVKNVINKIIQSHRQIDGVIHAAAFLRYTKLIDKSTAEINAVLGPKLLGTLNLDEATKEQPLQWFILFSSLSAIMGFSEGADYAAGNSFLDEFILFRQHLAATKQRLGRTFVINWPVWKEGGMLASTAERQQTWENWMFKSQGVIPMETHVALSAFENIMHNNYFSIIVMQGQANKNYQSLLTGCGYRQEISSSSQPLLLNSVETTNTLQQVTELAANILEIDPVELDVNADLSDYGYNSLTLLQLAEVLSERFHCSIIASMLIDHKSLNGISQWLSQHALKNTELKHTLEQITESEDSNMPQEEIAIVGMAGYFPNSDSVEEFWGNLINDEDFITEIPENRFDYRESYDPSRKNNKSISKWGGFLTFIDLFDAEYFKISELEAELMDPQQRMILMATWQAIESSGVEPVALSGEQIGVFIGIQFNDYQQRLLQQQKSSVYVATGNSHNFAANRISYLLNLTGPSIAIDTACSSSLVALDQAINAIKSKECTSALVGGVSCFLDPTSYIVTSQLGVISPQGKCKAFDATADGYVKGEGAGMVWIMPASAARKRGLPILALIKGMGVNHGGTSNSLTSPNVKAQQSLLVKTYRSVGVDLRSISYFEAHATGTIIGDSIEILALKQAYHELCGEEPVTAQGCAIGSIKSHIGHLEPAAGIASLIKIILMMQHRTIIKNKYLTKISPHIDLSGMPFYFAKETEAWEVSAAFPTRRAGISCFGFGGSNAHVIIEESSERSNFLGNSTSVRHRFNLKRYWVPYPLAEKTKAEVFSEANISEQLFVPKWQPYTVSDILIETNNKVDSIFVISSPVYKWLIPEIIDQHSNAKITVYYIGENKLETINNSILPQIIYMLPSAESELYEYFYLLQMFGRQSNQYPLNIKLLTQECVKLGDNVARQGEGSTLIGFCQALAKEFPQWNILSVDVLEKELHEKGHRENLLHALGSVSRQSGLPLLLRNKRWYHRSLLPLELTQNQRRRSALVAGGVYVILGGSGIVGKYLNHTLREKYAATVILVGRKAHNTEILDIIEALQSVKGQTYYRAADMTDGQQMKELFSTVIHEFKSINGVFHAGSTFEEETITSLNETSLKNSIAAKVTGSKIIAHVLKNYALDFLVFFSSAQSFTCNEGRAAYTAACVFQDNFANALQQRSHYPIYIINWGFWQLPKPELNDKLKSLGVNVITEKTGMEALDVILANSFSQVAMFDVDVKLKGFMGVDLTTKIRVQEKEAYLSTPIGYYEIKLAKYAEHFSKIESFALLIALEMLINNKIFVDHSLYSLHHIYVLLNVNEKYKQFSDFILTALVKQGVVEQQQQTYRLTRSTISKQAIKQIKKLGKLKKKYSKNMVISNYIEQLWLCREYCASVITGNMTIPFVVSNGGFRYLEKIYDENLIAVQYNKLLAKLVKEMITPIVSKRHLVKIIEVGAGTGSATKYISELLFSNLPEEQAVHYHFTDINPNFVHQAENHFNQLQCNVLNIEIDPAEQGYQEGEYDLMIASNVLHATENIQAALQNAKRLLKRHGYLVLNELVKNTIFITQIFGLFPEWWLANDGERELNSPLLSISRWREMLALAGFYDIQIYPNTTEPIDLTQAIIIAKSDGIILKLQSQPMQPIIAAISEPPSANRPSKSLDSFALTIKDVIAQFLKWEVTAIKDTTTLASLGVDSITAIEIANSLTKRLQCNVKVEWLVKSTTVQELIGALESKIFLSEMA